MVRKTITEILANPEPFVVSAPERCPPCKMLKEKLKDNDLAWVHASDPNLGTFDNTYSLSYMKIPTYIVPTPNGFIVGDIRPLFS